MIFSSYPRLLLALLSTLVLFVASANFAVADERESDPRHVHCEDATVESSNPLSKNCDAIKAGREVYVKFCSACHGGKADGWGGPSLGKQYAADLTKHWSGYQGYVTAVRKGKKGRLGLMPPWSKEHLSDEEMNQVGAYLETLATDKAYWK